MTNPFKNYTTASTAQQNFENNHKQKRTLTSKERAKKNLEAELYDLKHQHPEADQKQLHEKLYQFAYMEEMDEVFDDLELVVDEIITENRREGI